MIDLFARAIAEFLLDVVLVNGFYWPGWLLMRLISLGRYPPEKGVPHNQQAVALLGFVGVFALTVFVLMQTA